ncbi:[Protein ADP-ribosylarginine] hydrolase [Geodia barretti]|uniref:ADP-ribosylhydrolase ARH1 n=1 Tax=Geodia barretti TaxID=519541 RepID=A0AA35TAX9_GEOBA|nr:[Protein ADP-ribosylarginine] hydrolase [Geodia barretti]
MTSQRYEACMVLSGVGDALGYKNASWEFCRSDWRVSDDTVMHIATAEALLTEWSDSDQLYSSIALKYLESMKDMDGRAPGITCSRKVHMLDPHKKVWTNWLSVSIESGRMSHHHPTGYLGSLAVALFVSYSVQKRPLREWGAGLLHILDTAKQYIIEHSPQRDHKEHMDNWTYFEQHWKDYLALRQLTRGRRMPCLKTTT